MAYNPGYDPGNDPGYDASYDPGYDPVHDDDWAGESPWSMFRSLFPPAPQDRQGAALGASPLVVAALTGLALVIIQIIGDPRLNSEPAKLENDAMCGITTGGMDECWWNCNIFSSSLTAGQVVGSLTGGADELNCLRNCFSTDTSQPEYCITRFLDEVIAAGGTCDVGQLPDQADLAIWGLIDTCEVTQPDGINTFRPTITKGTCSEDTEMALDTPECQTAFLKQNGLLRNTLELLLVYSCTKTPFANPAGSCPGAVSDYPDFPAYPDYSGSGSGSGSGSDDSDMSTSTPTRLAPVSEVCEDPDRPFKTELDYTHTLHRYPWICSLRTRGANPEHLCAVTLLSVPPQPTVIVGAAHCTYQCRDTDANGVRLDACCCVTSQESCQDDMVKCGTKPRAVEMDGSDEEIICGEWETGLATPDVSGEEYNTVLPIEKIVRHPNFVDPGTGNDIAVFKVNDANIKTSNRIRPACLPSKNRVQPKKGVHSGWTKPPPFAFLEKFASGYTKYYSDFFKQWHYNMNISEKCEDPTMSQTFGITLEFPAQSYYPQGTICARDNTRQSCFSTGDSGSPLMAREENRPMRYYAEGILSFVKGCDTFTFGATNNDRTGFQLTQFSENPAAYTKLSCFLPWVAQQYGLTHEGDTDPSCRVGTGSKPTADTVCRETISNLLGSERECIFPFYYEGKLYNECVLFEQVGLVYPVFRCPTWNITTKIEGINSYTELETTDGLCQDFEGFVENVTALRPPLSPSVTCLDFLQVPTFSTCKNNCPGVRAFGIIAGGAILLAASGLGGLGLLPAVGLGGAGLVGGGMVAQQMCIGPLYCRARRTGQCCLVRGGPRGLRCPRSC